MAQLDALKKLHAAMLDTQSGYEVAERDAEDADLKSLFGAMLAMRRTDHEDIHQALLRLGEKPDEAGSFMGTVHRTVVNVRSTLKGIDRSSLSSFASGEDNALAAYDDALEESANRPDVADMLGRQREALVAKIAEMKAICA